MSRHSHFRMMACLYSSLRALSGQGNAPYVAVQTPIYYDEQRKHLAKQPDLMVIKGINNQDRAQYYLWDEGQVPAVIFEITSGETWMEDLVNKSSLYMQLGVKEYFIFDPYGEFLQNYVIGLRLVERDGRQEYLPIEPDKEGLLPSQELNTGLLVKDHLLRLVPNEKGSHDTGEGVQPIPWAEELYGLAMQGDGQAIWQRNGTSDTAHEELAQVQAQLQATEARLRQAEERMQQVDEQVKRGGQESQRIKTLEAENAHLRVLLGQMQGAKVVR
ncbi:MAG: Uma2 family endonuclease [Caldilineaceae bacterium]|nr:Uma2 family endonuclease [Caldilineaceae bacterium]